MKGGGNNRGGNNFAPRERGGGVEKDFNIRKREELYKSKELVPINFVLGEDIEMYEFVEMDSHALVARFYVQKVEDPSLKEWLKVEWAPWLIFRNFSSYLENGWINYFSH